MAVTWGGGNVGSGGGGGAGSSSPGQVLFNSGGAIAGDAGLTYDAATGLAVVSRAAPGAITITQQGTPGATAVVYMLVANMAGGLHTEAGVQSITATSNATLDGTNFNRLTWSPVTGAISYDIYRSMAPWTGSSSGKITATPITALTLDDTGLAGVGGPYAQPVNALGGSTRVGVAPTDANVPRLRVSNDGGIGLLLQSHAPIGGENPILVVKHYDPTLTYNVSSMISAAGGFYGVNWIAISGGFHANVAADGTFTIADLGITGMPNFMIGASSDLVSGEPAIAARANAVAGSLLYSGQDSSNNWTWAVKADGTNLFGAGATFASMDAGVGRYAGGIIKATDGTGDIGTGSIYAAGFESVDGSATRFATFRYDGMHFNNTSQVTFASGTTWYTGIDTGVARGAAPGTIKLTDGSTGGAVAVVGSKTKAIVDATPADFASFTIADGATYSGKILYNVKFVKGTVLQTLHGEVGFSVTRVGTAYVAAVGTTQEALTQVLAASDSGTLTGGVTIAATAGVVTLTATFNTSLSSPDTGFINYRFDSPDAGLAVTGL